MGRVLIVLFMLSLTSAAAAACHDKGKISQDHGDAARVSHEISAYSGTDGAIGRTSACAPLRRTVGARLHRPYPQAANQEALALFSTSWDVPLDRSPAQKQPRFRNLVPNKPSRFIPVAEGSTELETTMWRIVKESKSPADYEAYLDIFPKGRYAKQARETLARLRSKESGATPNKTRGRQPAPAVRIDRIEQNYTVRTTANLRQAPSIKSQIVGKARKGQELFVLGRAVGKNWYQVSTATGGVAYIASSLIGKRKPVGSKAPAVQDDRTESRSAVRKGPASRTGASSSSDASADKASGSSPMQQESLVRKSPSEIEAYWDRRINLVKNSGPYGDCDLVVDDPRTDPAQYSECQERNEILESLKLQMERELAGQR